MATITLKGSVIHTEGNLPQVGSKAPDFEVTKTDLSVAKLSDFKGKNVILNIFPSIDTGVCAASVRQFNVKASSVNNTVVVGVSKDLPFAHSRFCGAEGINNVITTSDFKDGNFAKAYGVKISDGPLAGLLSRAVVVIDEKGVVKYTEQVPEIAQEPNYDAALKAIS